MSALARIALLLLLSSLPACVAAIGNRSGSNWSLSQNAVPLVSEKVEAARRVVELCERRLGEVRSLHEAGRSDTMALIDAEIAVEEARIMLLQFRAELEATREAIED
ncbi:MAG: hypothetical protein AB7I19_19090 [Planctomycetota bacterium]